VHAELFHRRTPTVLGRQRLSGFDDLGGVGVDPILLGELCCGVPAHALDRAAASVGGAEILDDRLRDLDAVRRGRCGEVLAHEVRGAPLRCVCADGYRRALRFLVLAHR
jgi:hypothetical protein